MGTKLKCQPRVANLTHCIESYTGNRKTDRLRQNRQIAIPTKPYSLISCRPPTNVLRRTYESLIFQLHFHSLATKKA